MREPLLDAKQVAQLLGVSLKTVYRLSRGRTLRSVSVGRCLRFVGTDVDRFLKGGGSRLRARPRRR